MCFEDSMKNRTTQKTCDCPMECTSISYSFRVVSTKFEHKEMCGETNENSVMNDFDLVGHKFPHQFIRKLIHLKNNSVSSKEVEYCKRNLKYRAEVIFMLATDSMSVTIMSSRLSFFDKMSAFGKYKLFDNCMLKGSLLKVVYWACSLVSAFSA